MRTGDQLPDQGVIEFYKLAAAIIPVLCIGTVLQRLDPAPLRLETKRLDEAAERLAAQAARLREESKRRLEKLGPRVPPTRMKEAMEDLERSAHAFEPAWQTVEVDSKGWDVFSAQQKKSIGAQRAAP